MTRRILFPIYGIACYLVFLGSFTYLVGFVANAHIHLLGDIYFVPRGIDSGNLPASMAAAFIIDTALISLFAVQHSAMARQGFKALWTRVLVPPAVERSTYVLASSLCLIATFVFWQPIPGVVWSVEDPTLSKVLVAVSLLGFGIVLAASFMINHFDLFGLQQVFMHARRTSPEPQKFRTPFFYRFVRHPIYLGVILLYWVTPVMTVGHLLFAAGNLFYILIGIRLEERDLIRQFGDRYTQYKDRVRSLVPLPKRKPL